MLYRGGIFCFLEEEPWVDVNPVKVKVEAGEAEILNHDERYPKLKREHLHPAWRLSTLISQSQHPPEVVEVGCVFESWSFNRVGLQIAEKAAIILLWKFLCFKKVSFCLSKLFGLDIQNIFISSINQVVLELPIDLKVLLAIEKVLLVPQKFWRS